MRLVHAVAAAVLLLITAPLFMILEAAEPAPDLIVHLSFDELSGEGQVVTNEARSDQSIRLANHRLIEGPLDQALQFDGYPEQAINLGDLKLIAPATITFWFKSRDQFNDRRILSQADGPSTQAGGIRLNGAIEFWDGKSWQPVVNHGLRIDQWMHAVIVIDSAGKATGYLNGQQERTVQGAFDFDGVDALLGGKFRGEFGSAYNGALDDVRMYRGVLGIDEIARLHSLGASKK